jgi:hypothetical protein
VRLAIGQVGDSDERLTSQYADLIRDGRRRFLVMAGMHDDVGTSSSQLNCDGTSDAAGGSRHDGHLAVQFGTVVSGGRIALLRPVRQITLRQCVSTSETLAWVPNRAFSRHFLAGNISQLEILPEP